MGDVTFNDPVTLRSPFGSININNTITGQDASITLQGITNLKANLTTNNQNITIDGNTNLGANSTLTGSNVIFKGIINGEINGEKSLTVNASGITDFQQTIGGTTALNSLTTDAAGKTQINANVTTTGKQTYDDTVEIQNPVTLSTTNSNIAFNKTVDSQSGEANALTLDSGTGNISFNDSVGNTTALGNLSVNSSGTTLFNNTVKAASLTTDEAGTTNINGNITTTGDQTFGDTVEIQNSVTLSTSNSNIAFNKTVESQSGEANDLTLNSGTGNVSFNNSVGDTTALGNLSVNSSGKTLFNNTVKAGSLTTDLAGKTQINANVTTTGNQNYNDTVEIQNPVTLSTTNSNIAFNKTVESQSGEANDLTLNSGTRNVSFNNSVGDTTSLGNLSVNSSGTTLFNNTVKAASLTTDEAGTTNINGNITTKGNQTYNDRLTINDNISLTSTIGAIAIKETNITGDLTLTANNLEIGGQVSGNGTLTLQPYSSSLPINLGDNLSSDELAFTLSSSEINQLQAGFSEILIGQEEGSGQINVGSNVTFTSPVILRSPFGELVFNDVLDLSDDLTTDSPITINANINTRDNPMNFKNSVTFVKDITLNAGKSTISLAGTVKTNNQNVTFIADRIDWTGSINGTGKLTFQSSSSGRNILIGGTSTIDSNALNLTSAELSLISPNFSSVTIGNNNSPITITEAIAFNSDLNLAAANNTITVNQAINTKGKLTLNGETNLNANLTTQGQNLNINGNITLGNIATISTGNSGNINVTGNIQGSHSLNLQAGENLNTQNIDLSNTSGTGAKLALTATSGSINTGNLNTAGSTNGGDITIKAKTGASHIGMSINTYKALWTEKGKNRWER